MAIHVLVLNKIQTNWRTAAVKRRKNVVVETDGYLALIEHLSFNMDVFTQEGIRELKVLKMSSQIWWQATSCLFLNKTLSFILVFASNY